MSYSQNNEEKIILDFFKERTGCLLDIGANDGKTLSNSLALIERGWVGTLVEVSPTVFPRLKEFHGGNSNLTLLQYAIGQYNSTAKLYDSGELLGSGDVALVSSLLPKETERWTSLNMPFNEVEVEVIDFNKLLSLTPYQKYKFITIDIEGMEVYVVPQIDFDELETEMAIIEWNGNQPEFYDQIMVDKYKFSLIHINGENRIYAR